MKTFPQTETTFLIPSSSGQLELLTSPPKESLTPKNTLAIICHPHPLYAGTMHNKVVTTLKRVFSDLGLPTVRFNFRGVGQSTGTYGNAEGEIEDLFSVINWVHEVHPEADVCLAGFSFGSYIAARVASEINPKLLVSVAPPVVNFDFKKVGKISCPWIVVQGDIDDVVNPLDVYTWIETLNPQPKLIRIPDAGHFFHGQLLQLRELLESKLRETL